jgi:hypothetical protein
MKKLLIIAALVAVPLICLCSAKPLDQTIVDINANWLFHADYDQFNQSATGHLMKQQMSVLGLEGCFTKFSDKYAFHPIEDVKSVTIYGQGEDESKAVAFVHADFDKKVLLKLLEDDSTHEIIEYKDRSIHKFRSKKHSDDTGKIVFALLDTDKIALSTGLDSIKTASDNLDAKAAAATELLSLFNGSLPGIINIAGVNIAGNLNPGHNDIVLKRTDTLAMVIGEKHGKFYIDSNITAYDVQTAVDIENMMRGFISLGVLAHEKYPEWAKIALATQLVRNDRTINVYFEAEPEFILLMSIDAWKQKMARKCMD